MSDYVLTQDISSGRVHKRLRAESGYMSHEADNLDAAGAYRVISETDFDDIPADARCQRCFPSVAEDDGSTAPVDADAES